MPRLSGSPAKRQRVGALGIVAINLKQAAFGFAHFQFPRRNFAE
jgi:hypothetical protein